MSFLFFSDAIIEALLADDAGLGDLTTRALAIGGRLGRMDFTARDPMVLACCEVAARILEKAGASVTRNACSGAKLDAGAAILVASGPASALHRGWKVAQTLLESASGIATATRAIADAARAVRPGITIACTRKTMPGAKLVCAEAILAGGATMHRLNLSETILIFEEHRIFLSDYGPAQVIARARAAAPEKKIMVEVASPAEAMDWARAGADVIQAEKFTVEAIATVSQGLATLSPRPVLAAAGGINAANAALYARAGADVLVTSAPYQAMPRDIQVTFTRLG